MTDQLLMRMREMQDNEATAEEKEAWFEERTAKHIEMVQAAADKIVAAYPELAGLTQQVALHDQSKLVEPERTPYIEISWRHKQDNFKSYKKPGTLPDEAENKATLTHITSNSHHPEYHLKNKEDANINKNDRDKSDKVVDASAMPDIDVAEMVADWQAMSEELKKNTAREWYMKQHDVRWHFTDRQESLIDELLKVFEEDVEDTVECTNCKTKFDWVKLPECKMGYVKCPKCAWQVDQTGKAFESKEYDKLRSKAFKIFGICDCGEPMMHNRRLGNMVCKKCHPEITDRPENEAEKKSREEWDDAEHEHLGA